MRILLVADGRSPTTRRWLSGLIVMGEEVSLVSTYPCDLIPNLIDFQVIPVAFGNRFGFGAKPVSVQSETRVSMAGKLRKTISRFRNIFMVGRYFFGPFSLRYSGDITRFRQIVDHCRPDLVHALRIPFEGMLASFGNPDIPLVLSIWGNDLTLHAHGSPWMASLTRRSLGLANGLLADAQRDLHLACSWGFDSGKLSLVVPGSGGLDLKEIAACIQPIPASILDSLPAGTRLLINPRGYRPGSLRNDTFFKAIPYVIKRVPEAVFLCPSMAGQADAIRWVKKLGIQNCVRLLPSLSQPQLWSIFHQAEIFISPSVHDGTPNSFLEAIACGCFPVVGDIESFREWINPGSNGLLIDPTDPGALADAILMALSSSNLRRRGAEINAGLVADRVEVNRVREKISTFYQHFNY